MLRNSTTMRCLSAEACHPSRQRLQAALAAKKRTQARIQIYGFDPIASAMERHPGLTREEAEEFVHQFGF